MWPANSVRFWKKPLGDRLAHVPEKWEPFSDKDMRSSMNLERILIRSNRDAL
jgi:hypothetical protein